MARPDPQPRVVIFSLGRAWASREGSPGAPGKCPAFSLPPCPLNTRTNQHPSLSAPHHRNSGVQPRAESLLLPPETADLALTSFPDSPCPRGAPSRPRQGLPRAFSHLQGEPGAQGLPGLQVHPSTVSGGRGGWWGRGPFSRGKTNSASSCRALQDLEVPPAPPASRVPR